LATAIILKSGLIHFADKPEIFRSLPAEALKVFRDAPARWDETRCLIGEPGRSAVFARRAAGSWFIAGLNGTSAPLTVDLDLSPFADFRKRLSITEGTDPVMEVLANAIPVASHWTHQLPAAGGFILRLYK
jgi:alpha-glucosidase